MRYENKYTQDKLKKKSKYKELNPLAHKSKTKGPKFYVGFLGLLTMTVLVVGGLASIPLYFIVGNNESLQREAHCTISQAYKSGSGGGLKSSSATPKIIIETKECGDLVYRGDLGTDSTDEAVDLLNSYHDQKVLFWVHPIQLSDWIDSLVQVKRIELPQ